MKDVNRKLRVAHSNIEPLFIVLTLEQKGWKEELNEKNILCSQRPLIKKKRPQRPLGICTCIFKSSCTAGNKKRKKLTILTQIIVQN